jgi:DNA mismatch repair protein MSH5
MLNGQFQVRPWKEFTAARGLARLQSLPLLAGALASETDEDPQSELDGEPRNAYDFMRRRGSRAAHPALAHWIADVRLGNFTLDSATAPFCVSIGNHCDLTIYRGNPKAIHNWRIIGSRSTRTSSGRRLW